MHSSGRADETEPSPPPSSGVPGEGVRPITRILVLLFATLHLLVAVAVWWLMPGGFPLDHPRFWVNRMLPTVVLLFAVTVIVMAKRQRWTTVTALLLCTPITMLAAAISGAVVFPMSGMKPAIVVTAFTLVLILAIRRRMIDTWPGRKQLALFSIVPLLIGAALPLSQRAPLPDTRPHAKAGKLPTTRPLDTMLPNVQVTPIARVAPSAGLIMTSHGGRRVNIEPVLTFTSRSPDRCWTNLASRRHREEPRRRLFAIDTLPNDVMLFYLDDGFSLLRVTDDPDALAVRMISTSTLPHDVYSHLNHYARITVDGHRKLSLVFSPAPNTPLDVRFSEYPIGQPMRTAHLTADGMFRVVEASSGEKGPFRELASGRLSREKPLGIELRDDGVTFAKITLRDFASQAGVQLSPTAGWGLPVNSVDFSLYDNRDTSMAFIYVSLASTGVGRGWDSVGHAAGTYRNQMKLEYLDQKASDDD